MHKHFVSEVKRERCKILERRGGGEEGARGGVSIGNGGGGFIAW